MHERTHEKRSLQKSDDSTSGEHQEAQVRHHLNEQHRPSKKKCGPTLGTHRLTHVHPGRSQAGSEVRRHQTRPSKKKERGRVTSLSPLDHPCCLFSSTVQPKTTHRLKLGFVHTQVRHKTFRRNVTTRHRQPNHRHHCPPQVGASQRRTPKLLDL